MIKLNKLPEPTILENNKGVWTQQYLNCVQRGQKAPDFLKYKYREEDIKATLIEETHSKCVYCESKMLHVTFGEIDHILPYSKLPELIFEWENLTLSCPRCNNSKRAYYDPNWPLINPYLDDPKLHFIFFGPMLFSLPGKKRAWLTEKNETKSPGPF